MLISNIKKTVKKAIRTIKSLIWIIRDYSKFKRILISKYGFYQIRPFKLSLWRNGTKYFHAYHTDTVKRKVFIKTMGKHNDVLREADMLKTIEEQRRANQHWKTPKVISLQIDGEYAFVAMEYIEGVSLSKLIRENRLSINDKTRIANAFVHFIEFVHNHQIIHRDLRPDNILVSTTSGDIEIVIIDFALAVNLAVDEREDSDINQPREILAVLGSGFNPEPFVWDDAYSLHRIIQIMDTTNEVNPELSQIMESKIGKVTYHLR